MSERGSYCTEFIYCAKCAVAAQEALQPDEGGYHEAPVMIDRAHILAGRLSGLYPGQEIDEFKARVVPRLRGSICHRLRIAVMAECGEEIVVAEPI